MSGFSVENFDPLETPSGSLPPVAVDAAYQSMLVKEGDTLTIERDSLLERVAQLEREKAALNDRVNTLGIDLVTGLPVRRLMDEEYERTVRPHDLNRRNEPELSAADTHSVIFLDIDNFGPVNKEHGDTEGDIVLASVVNAMLRRVRHGDTLGKFGGEEFVLFAYHTTPDQAALAAEDLRAIVADTRHTEKVPHVTVSVGVGQLLVRNTMKEGITEASQAMRVAKAWGKNQVVVFDQIPSYYGKQPALWE